MEIYNTVDIRKNEIPYIAKSLKSFITLKIMTDTLIYSDGSRVNYFLSCLHLTTEDILKYGNLSDEETIAVIQNFDKDKKIALAILFNEIFDKNISSKTISDTLSILVKSGIDVVNPRIINSEIDLSNINFLSKQHFRYEEGKPNFSNENDIARFIKINRIPENYYLVSVEDRTGKTVLSPKKMKIIYSNSGETILRGCGFDENGFSFIGYGLSINHTTDIKRVFIHWYDRDVSIEYLK